MKALAFGLALLSAACFATAGVSSIRPSVRIGTRVLPAGRVRATPVPLAAPVPVPTPARAVAPPRPPVASRAPSAGWTPRLDAGPWRTDGTVALPTLGVSAPLVRVGIDRDGNMVTPRSALDVAWLDPVLASQGAPAPGVDPDPLVGASRNAILAGHKNWAGARGSFDGIGRLAPGDPVVASMSGRTWRFAVEWVRLYDPATAPVDELLGATSQDSITLVTCGGEFDRRSRHYNKRWVARATLVPD